MATIPIRRLRREERLLSEAIVQRRSTPHFDGSPISDEALSAILQAGIESPSGYNLQPWRFIVVRDPQQKKRLREAAMDQAKVEEASGVIVFCGDLNAARDEALERMLAEAARHGFSEEQNRQVKAIVTAVLSAPPGDAMGVFPDWGLWLNRHVMIAFTTMMWMAETLGYDTAPMEGFFESKVKSVLGIPNDVRVIGLLALGRLKGPDKPYAGRHPIRYLCFSEEWGEPFNA